MREEFIRRTFGSFERIFAPQVMMRGDGLVEGGKFVGGACSEPLLGTT